MKQFFKVLFLLLLVSFVFGCLGTVDEQNDESNTGAKILTQDKLTVNVRFINCNNV